jgi:hypothetical protein
MPVIGEQSGDCIQCQQGQQEIRQAQEMLNQICNRCAARTTLHQQGCECSCAGGVPQVTQSAEEQSILEIPQVM